MRVITFYSYKGGVGRSLAAANFSVYLAKLGLKTVLIDFDLEAPGIDAKFPLLKVPNDQKGILDYILHYQQKNEDPGSLRELYLKIPVSNKEASAPLWLIPAGQYLSESYYKKLSQLDWSLIFSQKRDGVAFFQQFIARIKNEIEADFVIIDSRTGITEIAGLCTQQLADEVVMLSSLSSESIKVTKHIKRLIQESQVAKALEKSIDVKVVVSRVPKSDDLESFKKKCCEQFETEENKLFFLFSCSKLEQEEFLAITEAERDEELVNNYVRLFYGLDLENASDGIQSEIERISSNLLFSSSPEESERQVLGLVALYPHPDVYRAAMHFFQHERKPEEIRSFAWKLFELMPDDDEAQSVLANSYLSPTSRSSRLRENDKKDAIRVLEPLWKKGKLTAKQSTQFAHFLEDAEQYSKSFDIAFSICEEAPSDLGIRNRARAIAARTAFKLGKRSVAAELIESLPLEQLDSSLALVAVEIRISSGDLDGAFEIAKVALVQDFSPILLRQAVSLATQLGRKDELEEATRNSREFQLFSRQPNFRREVRQLGLSGLVDEEDF
jgi:MinD-like ATPase involved in chromosome partitioning or flagellar assembly